MMNIEDKVFTLSNGKRYMVLETVDYENNKYVYLSNVDNELDTMFVKLNLKNGVQFEKIEKSFLSSKILPLFFEKFGNY